MNAMVSLLERADKYLQSAQLLLDAGDYESSVSRTYYAMFFAAEALLLSKDISSSSHKGVISSFGLHFIKTGIFPREMGRELNRAFGKRQIGDYEFQLLILRGEAEEMLQSGNQFVKNVRQYFAANGFI
ncbi:MAG: HEPN domain-containing protein [Chloroflexi bacterium]|nr:HEPN domain-containing protein [Chloroflexota bacterium]